MFLLAEIIPSQESGSEYSDGAQSNIPGQLSIYLCSQHKFMPAPHLEAWAEARTWAGGDDVKAASFHFITSFLSFEGHYSKCIDYDYYGINQLLGYFRAREISTRQDFRRQARALPINRGLSVCRGQLTLRLMRELQSDISAESKAA